MHVVRDRPHVIEELRVNRPFLVFVPDRLADQRRAAFGDGLLQGEAMPSNDDVAQALVRRAVFVGRGRGGGEPAFVDAAAVQAVGVKIVRVQLQALARLKEERGTQHGARRSRPPVAEISASTKCATFALSVFRDTIVSITQRARSPEHIGGRIDTASPFANPESCLQHAIP